LKMLNLLRITAILVLFGSTGLIATQTQPGELEFSGDLLYMAPLLDDTYYVFDSPITSTSPSGQRKNNDFEFLPGFRLGLKYGLCECNREATLAFTWLGATQRSTTNGPFLWATVGRADLVSSFENYAGSASSKLNILYERVDALLGQQIYDNCGLNIDLNLGLEYAFLRLSEDYEYASATALGLVHQRSRAWAIGPQLGLDLNYCLFQICQFVPGTVSLHVCTSTSILAARSDIREIQTLDGASVANTRDEHAWRLVPALHARVGIKYDACFCSMFDTSLEFGYEFNSYLRGLSRISFPDDVADGLAFTNYYNFDVQGFYVSLAVGF
jgi:hypothetical protein